MDSWFLDSISDEASIFSPVQATIDFHYNYKDRPDDYAMYVIKVNAKEMTVTGYGEGVIMDLLDPAKVKAKNKLIRPEYFLGQRELSARKKLILHTAVVRYAYRTYDEDLFEVPYEKFVKVGWDECITYGDGGEASLIYPLFLSRRLQVSSEIKSNLINELLALGERRKDWHGECPVLDIIDPDLAPNYLSKHKPGKISEREKYAWFPLDVIIRSDNSLRLLGPIHNLSPGGNTQLYHSIFTVFQKMIPGFRKLGVTKKGQECKLQVVVKAQKYLIAPGTSYSGKWHVEGRTENIVAGGVYYCKIDEGFDQDIVVFRPRQGPREGYSALHQKTIENEIDVTEGCAIVFSNILPHKFLKLTNNTDSPLERLFLNFFIIDPTKEIESTTSYWETEKALRRLKKLPTVLIDYILSFLIYRPNLTEAKERRKIVREAMMTELSGWGFITYGNSGDVEFIDYSTKPSKLERYDTIIGADVEKLSTLK